MTSGNEASASVPRTPFGEREAALLAASQRGHLAAWNDLATSYWPEVNRVCFLVLRHHQDAEDACVETFMKAQAALDTFKEGSFGAWLTTIARNTSADELRKRRRRDATIKLIGGAQESLALLDSISMRAAIERFRVEERGYLGDDVYMVLAQLSPRERRIVQLAFLDDLPTWLIGRRFGRSEKYIRAVLRRARQGLEALAVDRAEMLAVLLMWHREVDHRDSPAASLRGGTWRENLAALAKRHGAGEPAAGPTGGASRLCP